ncbi:O-antigen translocase [Providencia alcalifaciens]|uniref:O-antigen translocase n=1 Tax=Providencia alcalifaciens TaxID=126385 RepID=UPI0032DA36DD
MKKLLKVSMLTGLLTLLRMIMGFIIAKTIAIYSGPTGMAMLGQIQNMVTCLNGVINAPVGSGVVRYTAENIDNGFSICSAWWKAALHWVLIISVIIIPIGVIFSSYIASWLLHDESLAWIINLSILFLPLTAIGTICNSIINGQQLYRRFIFLGMFSTLISSIIMIVMIIFMNIYGALIAASIQTSLIGIIMFVANIRQPWLKIQYWWGKQDKKAHKEIASYMMMALTTAATVPISLIIIRNILISEIGWTAAGYWQALWKISEAYLSVITIALGTYYLPRLSSLKDKILVYQEVISTAKIILPIVICLSFIIYLMRDIIIALLFTDDFLPIRDLFAIQLCGDVIKILSWIFAYPMLARGATKWFISTEIIFSISFISLTQLFVSFLGVSGVTLAYLLNYTLYFILISLNLKKII